MRPKLLQVYREAIKSRSLGDLINQGNIKSIPKVVDLEITNNWFPITLLNIPYNILPMALSLEVEYLHAIPTIGTLLN
jgi:hypothetical protein